jgi:hypothetical protein
VGNYANFDQAGYLRAVKSAIMDELQYLEPYIENIMRTRLGAVQWRSVDAKYKSESLNSIKATVLQKANSFVMSMGAGGGKGEQNQAFRAVYYEYGTGNLMQPPADWQQGSDGWGGWNMARKGRDIYQRPYGQWIDLGGNVHKSKVRGAPKKMANKGLGREIAPEHWFAYSLNASLSMLDSAVRRAVKSVPISAYIGIRSIHKRM